MENNEIDPYQVLDVPYWAAEEEIKAAFQKRMKESKNENEVISAYGMIRDKVGREKVEWGAIRFCSHGASPTEERPEIDVEALVRELAFCTPWELGDDTCLKL